MTGGRMGRQKVDRTQSGSDSELAALVGLLYIALSSAWMLHVFSNFSFFAVMGVVGVFAAFPAALLVKNLRPSSSVSLAGSPRMFVVALALAGGLALHSAAGLVAFDGYVSNHPNQRLEVGGGFDPDAAFHAAIIQNIRNTGIASTGQHLNPPIRYHVLSHYVDAAVTAALALDVWESYALRYFGRMLLISLLAVRLASCWSSGLSIRWFLLAFAILGLVLLGDWHLVSSYGQWFGGALLIGLGPWFQSVVGRAELDGRHWMLLTAVYIALVLSKISLGTAFGAAVLTFAMLRTSRRSTVVGMAILWGTFAISRGVGYLPRGIESGLVSAFGYPGEGLAGRLRISGAVFIGCVSLAGVLFMFARRTRQADANAAAISTGATTAFALFVAIFVGSGMSDAFYFMSGALIVTLVLFGGIPFGFARSAGTVRNGSASMHITTVAMLVLLLGLTPLLQGVYLSPTSDVETIGERLRQLPESGARWQFPALSQEPRSDARSLSKEESVAIDFVEANPFFSRMREALSAELDLAGLSRREALLFLSSEEFDLLAAEFELRNGWATGLLVTAITGLALVHAVPVGAAGGFYGYSDYPADEALRKPREVMTADRFCRFDRPVIVFDDILALRLSLICID